MARLRIWHGLLATIALVLALFLANCSAPGPVNNPTSNSAKTLLVYGSGGQPVNLEPGNVTDGNSLVVQNQIYNRLLDFKPGTPELQPSLATDWAVSEDGLTWTFKLRSGVQFHDGTPFNAEAVQFNINRWWDPQHPYGYRDAGKTYEIWPQIFGGYKGDPSSVLAEVKVVDEFTIAFKLTQPFTVFPAAIGAGYFGIASPSAIQKSGASYGTPTSQPVGTGGFQFQTWRTGDRIQLIKNSNYWKTNLPIAEQLVIRFITDPSARLAQLRAKQVDFTVDLAPDQQTELEQAQGLETVIRPSFNVGYLALNPAYKPLSDRRVRQAIAHAINRPAIVKAFWGELASTDAHFTPPALAEYQAADLEPYPYDPNRAKKLLAEAGYPNGFELDLWYMPVSRPYFPTPKPIAEAFAADLSAVGIRANLKTQDWAAYLADRNQSPGFQSFMLGWTGDYGDPDSFYYPHFGPGSTADLGNWSDPQVLKLLEQGRQINDKSTRTKTYAELDRKLHQEALRLPIVHSQPLLAQRRGLTGWQPSPLGAELFETIKP